MKKIIYLASAIVFAVSCTNGSKENNDPMPQTDSTTTLVATDSLASQATTPADTVKVGKEEAKNDKDNQAEEKSKPSPNAKKIDKDLKWFEHDVKQYVENVKAGMMGYELWELQEPCIKNEKNLKKYEKEMTPEQKAKFKKYQKMLNKY